MKHLLEQTPDEVLTICPLGGNMCPTVQFHGDMVVLQDDAGGVAVMTLKELMLAVDQVKV